VLTLKNPHSILAALERRPQDVQQISLPREPDGLWVQIARLAREHRIAVTEGQSLPRDIGRHDRHREKETTGGRIGFGEARVREKEGVPVEVLFKDAKEKNGGRGLWLALDTLQDPHNIGAIFRCAAFFGVQGILITEERSAPVSGVAFDVASGGLEYVPFAYQVNLQRAFEVAKEAGLWVLGSSEHVRDSYRTVLPDRPWLLVLGNEEKGMRRLTEESCDVLCGIPSVGGVKSLNVSVAAGILISHLAVSTQ
jgi:23S rRNA (guanosine2251-2'-O)-methyltransferase